MNKKVHIVVKMNILKFQIVNATEDELDLVPEFIDEIYIKMFKYINNFVSRKKIAIRLNYLLNDVNWIQWTKSKYNTSVEDIINSIWYSLDYNRQRNNTYNLRINPDIKIPNSATSIDKLIRFIEYGDIKYKATGMFNKMIQSVDIIRLNSMWQVFILQHLQIQSKAKLIQK